MRAITAQDLWNFKFLSDPQISPDGQSILFVVTRPKWKVGYVSDIWKLEGKRLHKLTNSTDRYFEPRWSSDGKRIAAGRSKSMVGTELVLADRRIQWRSVLRLDRNLYRLKWSRDGERIFFLSDWCRRKGTSDVKIIRRINFKLDGLGFIHDRRTHIFSLGVKRLDVKQHTKGEFDVRTYDVSPNGDEIIFASNLAEDCDFSNAVNLYKLRLGHRTPELFVGNSGPIMSVDYSPTGRQVAYVGHDCSKSLHTNFAVWVTPPDQPNPKNATVSLDRSAINSLGSDARMASPYPGAVWIGEDNLLFHASDQGSCGLFKVNLRSGNVNKIIDEMDVDSFSVSRNGEQVAIVAMSPTKLNEVWLHTETGLTRVTHFNDSLFDDLRLTTPTKFTFKASDNVPVDAWVFFPPQTKKRDNSSLPAITVCHGGRTSWGNTFVHEFQLLAAAGFLVLCVNFRSTPGYGEEFGHAVTGHYMEKDFTDIMEATEYVVKKGWCNPTRLGVMGGSYGGYLTNWIISHTKKFKAAVAERSVVNLHSFYATGDYAPLFFETEVTLRTPWDNLDYYLAKSPIKYVANMEVPVLIIHSDDDHRVAVEQAEQLFVSLKRLGREVVFARFPGEGHDLSRSGRPEHRVERLNLIHDWFKKHL